MLAEFIKKICTWLPRRKEANRNHFIWVMYEGLGWLKVPIEHIATLQLEELLSESAFIIRSYVYLPEGQNADLFLDALVASDLVLMMKHENLEQMPAPSIMFGSEAAQKIRWEKLRQDAS